MGWIPVRNPRAQALDLSQAPLHVPLPFHHPLMGHVDEPVAHDWVGEDFAAFCRVAAGLVFNECSGWGGRGGWGGTRSAGASNLPRVRAVGRWCLPGATSPAAVSGHHAGARRARSQCCPLERLADHRLTGGQLRPTDKAMARSARTSSSEDAEEDAEEDAREEDRLLTKRCIEWHWKNTWLEKHIV